MYELKLWVYFFMGMVFVSIPLLFVVQTNSVITIQKPYLEEYQQCKIDLKEAKEIKCPDIKCKETINTVFLSWFWGLLGLIMWLYGLTANNKKTKELNEKELELKQKEKCLLDFELSAKKFKNK